MTAYTVAFRISTLDGAMLAAVPTWDDAVAFARAFGCDGVRITPFAAFPRAGVGDSVILDDATDTVWDAAHHARFLAA